MVQGMVMTMWWCSKDNYDDDNVGDDDDDEDDDDDCNHQTEEGGLCYKDEGTLADQQIISWGILSVIELNPLITIIDYCCDVDTVLMVMLSCVMIDIKMVYN